MINKFAKKLVEAGINVIPLNADKTPDVPSWSPYKHTMWSDFDKQFEKIGIICGAISNNIEVIDIDLKYDLTKNLYKKLVNRINYHDKELLNKLVIQKTISGGYHFIYRCAIIEGNKKLASRETVKGEEGKIRTLIETRGEGGYIVAYPSDGYDMVQGDLLNVQEITEYEREVLMSCCISLGELTETIYVNPRHIKFDTTGLTPWDDFNARGPVEEMLVENGWTVERTDNERVFFCRPGKSHGISADFHTYKRLFKTFTSSTEFEEGKGYSPFATFAYLECNKDFSRAARELYELGYGDRSRTIDERKLDIGEEVDPLSLISSEADEQEYLDSWKNGTFSMGLPTGYETLDKHFRFKRGNFVMVNGLANIGKSTMIWYFAVLSCMLHGWKWAIHAGENREGAVRKAIMQFYIGKTFDYMSHDDYEKAKKWAYDNFYIIKTEDFFTADSLLACASGILKETKFDALLIDPYNSLVENYESSKGKGSHEFHYEKATQIRLFCKNNDVSIYVNMHPISEAQRRAEAPKLVEVEGGAKWANRVDDGLVFHRDFSNEDETVRKSTQIIVAKIKETETGGKPTYVGKPIMLMLGVVNDFWGFWDEAGRSPIYDYWHPEGGDLRKNYREIKIEYETNNDLSFNTDFDNEVTTEYEPF